MKITRYLLGFALAMAVLLSCERDFQAPPLTEPIYIGDEANITIAKLKTLYANITDPVLIDVDYIIRATVIANDISGISTNRSIFRTKQAESIWGLTNTLYLWNFVSDRKYMFI
jgi:hypothetical protein